MQSTRLADSKASGEDWTALGAGSLAMCGAQHGHLHCLAESVRAQRFRPTLLMQVRRCSS